MQESFWWWQCSDRYIISTPPFSPALISLMVSVDVKHHVYLLTDGLNVATSVESSTLWAGTMLLTPAFWHEFDCVLGVSSVKFSLLDGVSSVKFSIAWWRFISEIFHYLMAFHQWNFPLPDGVSSVKFPLPDGVSSMKFSIAWWRFISEIFHCVMAFHQWNFPLPDGVSSMKFSIAWWRFSEIFHCVMAFHQWNFP